MFKSYEIHYAMQSFAIYIIRVLQMSTVIAFLWNILEQNSLDIQTSDVFARQKYMHLLKIHFSELDMCSSRDFVYCYMHIDSYILFMRLWGWHKTLQSILILNMACQNGRL